MLAPAAGPVAGFRACKQRPVSNGSIVAWKVDDQGRQGTDLAGLDFAGMVSPLPPIVVNGVVFALSAGKDGRAMPSFTRSILRRERISGRADRPSALTRRAAAGWPPAARVYMSPRTMALSMRSGSRSSMKV